MPDRLYTKFSCAVPGVPEGLNRAAFLLIAGYLFILPISHTTTIREILFLSLVGITLWSAWRHGLALHLPGAKAWAVYAAVASLSLFYALNPIYSLKEIKAEIVYSLLTALAAASWVGDKKTLSRLIWVLIIGNVFLIGFAVIEGVFAKINGASVGQIAPLQIGVGKFSTYIITVVPFLLAQMLCTLKSRRAACLALLVLTAANLVALYFTGNRAGLLALFIESALLASLLWRYHIPLVKSKVLILSVVSLLLLSVALNFVVL